MHAFLRLPSPTLPTHVPLPNILLYVYRSRSTDHSTLTPNHATGLQRIRAMQYILERRSTLPVSIFLCTDPPSVTARHIPPHTVIMITISTRRWRGASPSPGWCPPSPPHFPTCVRPTYDRLPRWPPPSLRRQPGRWQRPCRGSPCPLIPLPHSGSAHLHFHAKAAPKVPFIRVYPQAGRGPPTPPFPPGPCGCDVSRVASSHEARPKSECPKCLVSIPPSPPTIPASNPFPLPILLLH